MGEQAESAQRPAAVLPGPLAAALVAVASAVVLVLEILALRLVAPYVGVTLETNTAVIGVALSAIAAGAWLGGRLADLVDPRPLLAPLLLAGAAATTLVLPVVRWAGELLRGADVVGVLLLAMVAVFVPGAVLSAVPPMVAKIQLADLRRAGSVVGRLSSLSTAGAIVATFLTGFVLVATLPTSVILLVAAGVAAASGLVLAGPWASSWGTIPVRGRKRAARRTAVLTLLVFVASGLVLLAPRPCEVETAYHCAQIVSDPQRPGGRVLQLDSLRHSYVDLDDPRYLQFSYVKVLASVADVLRPPGEPLSAAHLGGGGMTVPRYLLAARPGSVQRVYEVDAGVVELDREVLRLPDDPGLTVWIGDARIGLAGERDGQRDLVVGDAFGGLAVPWHLATAEMSREVRRVLAVRGVFAINIIDYPPLRLLAAEIATLRAVFGEVSLIAPPGVVDRESGGNAILLAGGPLDPTALGVALTARDLDWRILDPAATADWADGAPVLTDDYAPADQLLTTYG